MRFNVFATNIGHTSIVILLHNDRYYFCSLAMSKLTFPHSHFPIPVPPGYHEHQRPAARPVTAGGAVQVTLNTSSRPGMRGGSREGGERRREIRASPSRPMSPREQFNQMSLQEEWMKRMNGTPSDKDEEVRREEEREYSDQKITCTCICTCTVYMQYDNNYRYCTVYCFPQRYKYYIAHGVRVQDIEPMPSNQMNLFYKRVSPALTANPDYASICSSLETEILSDYQYSLRKAVVDYILIDPDEKKRLNINAVPLSSPRR